MTMKKIDDTEGEQKDCGGDVSGGGDDDDDFNDYSMYMYVIEMQYTGIVVVYQESEEPGSNHRWNVPVDGKPVLYISHSFRWEK